MFLSERDCQRWRSFDIRPAISKAKTPTFLDFREEGFEMGWCGVEEVFRTASKIAVFTLSSRVSSAMYVKKQNKERKNI